MWVIPWRLWSLLEDELIVANEVKPEDLRIPISEIERFYQYELDWQGKGVWGFNVDHPILLLAKIRTDHEWDVKSIRFPEEKK